VGDAPNSLGLVNLGGVVRGRVEHPLLREGPFMTLGRGKSFFAADYGGGYVVWGLRVHAKEGEFRNASNPERLERVEAEVGSWHNPIPELVRKTADGAVTCRDLYDQEPPLTARDGTVVLLGDACHPMSPFRG